MPTLGVVRDCESRGLTREAFGFVDLFQWCFFKVYVGCHSPFPEVVAVFGFFDVL